MAKVAATCDRFDDAEAFLAAFVSEASPDLAYKERKTLLRTLQKQVDACCSAWKQVVQIEDKARLLDECKEDFSEYKLKLATIALCECK
mmetsp:Transcript_7638/g.8632  ORF Transcript_7638/g.8632 Transcript_7638/m.8632 type:complete len:89 (-) Transcript_7638:502-768(-)